MPHRYPTAMVISGFATHLAWPAQAIPGAGWAILRAGTDGLFTTIATLPATVTSFDDLQLTPNTLYTYRIDPLSTGGASAAASSPAPSLHVRTFARGDVNGDYSVDFFDIATLLSAHYNDGTAGHTWSEGTWADAGSNGRALTEPCSHQSVLSPRPTTSCQS